MSPITIRLWVLVLLVGFTPPESASSQDPCSYPSLPVKHSGATTSFIAFGDSGTGKTPQYRLGRQMEVVRKTVGFRFAVMLGDNIYGKDGIKLIRSRFERPYAELLKAGVKFYPVLGNHDLEANEGFDQIAYFKMPGRWYSFKDGDAEFFALDSNPQHVNQSQIDWIHTTLSASSAHWKIAIMHHPIYSSGPGGSSIWVQEKVEPLLVKHGVTLALAGNDHHYERINPQKGITYFVSGGGGAKLRPVAQPKPFSEVALSVYHFILFELSRATGWFQAINICGRVFDKGTLTPRQVAH